VQRLVRARIERRAVHDMDFLNIAHARACG
jgi:hypothetical protein